MTLSDETVSEKLKENVVAILNDLCLFGNCELGRMVGFIETEEDYYYSVAKLHGERVLISCVGSVLSLRGCIPEDHYANMDAIYTANGCGPVAEMDLGKPSDQSDLGRKSYGFRALDIAVSDSKALPDREKLIALWVNEFKNGSPSLHQNAMARIHNGVAQVDLFFNTETGEPLWSLVDTSKDDGFWMESFCSEAQARNFVKGMGWDIRNNIRPTSRPHL